MNTEAAEKTIEQQVDEFLAARSITIAWAFVPWSKSRNAGERYPSLNWKADIFCYGAPQAGLTRIDYTQGCGHVVGCKQMDRSIQHAEYIRQVCETGITGPGSKRQPNPKAVDLFYSLVSDAEALDYSTFESWADSFGYDPDSRKAETIYRQCVAIGLALRALLGDARLVELQEMVRGY